MQLDSRKGAIHRWSKNRTAPRRKNRS
jgi:hypothetical protein